MFKIYTQIVNIQGYMTPKSEGNRLSVPFIMSQGDNAPKGVSRTSQRLEMVGLY